VKLTEALRVLQFAPAEAPAVGFKGRRIAWALTAQKLLLEFLEEVST
jgi:hypothetical protein